MGASQQQVRNVYANIGCFNLNCWMYTLVEVWAWEKSEDELIERSEWDQEERRPSHADKRRALQRTILREEIKALLGRRANAERFRRFAEHLLDLAA